MNAQSPVIGRTIEAAGLRGLQGLFIVEMERKDGRVISSPSPGTDIQEGDLLTFAGGYSLGPCGYTWPSNAALPNTPAKQDDFKTLIVLCMHT